LEAISVCINGKKRQVPAGTTLGSLIDLFQLKNKSVALELNHQVIERERYAATHLNENDAIEIVQFVGGG